MDNMKVICEDIGLRVEGLGFRVRVSGFRA